MAGCQGSHRTPLFSLTSFCVPAKLTMALDFPASAPFALHALSFHFAGPAPSLGTAQPSSMTWFKLCFLEEDSPDTPPTVLLAEPSEAAGASYTRSPTSLH